MVVPQAKPVPRPQTPFNTAYSSTFNRALFHAWLDSFSETCRILNSTRFFSYSLCSAGVLACEFPHRLDAGAHRNVITRPHGDRHRDDAGTRRRGRLRYI